MSRPARDPLIERILERTARALGGGGLHPLVVLNAIEDACSAAARDGVAPNQVVVAFHPRDYLAYRPALADLEREVLDVLDRLESERGLTRIGGRLVSFVRDSGQAEGAVSVRASFADTRHRPAQLPPRGATQRIERHRGVVLCLGDGSRVALTHTPFSIGRGAGNDLVLVSMAVSRQHARVVSRGGAFAIEDLGSRNGILVQGERQDVATLEGEDRVRLGDVDLWLEREG